MQQLPGQVQDSLTCRRTGWPWLPEESTGHPAVAVEAPVAEHLKILGSVAPESFGIIIQDVHQAGAFSGVLGHAVRLHGLGQLGGGSQGWGDRIVKELPGRRGRSLAGLLPRLSPRSGEISRHKGTPDTPKTPQGISYTDRSTMPGNPDWVGSALGDLPTPSPTDCRWQQIPVDSACLLPSRLAAPFGSG